MYPQPQKSRRISIEIEIIYKPPTAPEISEE